MGLKKQNCLHRNINIITEIERYLDKNGFITGESTFKKIWVECIDCGEILPINTITQETRYNDMKFIEDY